MVLNECLEKPTGTRKGGRKLGSPWGQCEQDDTWLCECGPWLRLPLSSPSVLPKGVVYLVSNSRVIKNSK